MNGSMLNLGSLSPVTSKLIREIRRRALQTVCTQKRIVHMLDPSDTVVFSGARTCGIVVPLIKDREIRLESRK
jgi:hypothetical protein